MKKLALTFSILALTACGGGSGSIDDITGKSTERLAGIWKSEVDEGEGEIDEAYLVFETNGLVTIYDYAGDSHDDVANCYWIGNAQIKSKGNNKYELIPMDAEPDDILEVTITVSGNTMTLKYEDEDEPEEKLTRSTLKESDFTPECDINSSTRTQIDIQKNVKGIMSIKANDSRP